MAYPRRCRLCRTDYTTAGPPKNWQVTLRVDSDGSPSRRHPERQGRRLLLHCLEARPERGYRRSMPSE